MSSGIFTRKAGELIFHNKIQQSSIDFTRFNIIKRSNRSAKEIIIIGIGKVTQFKRSNRAVTPQVVRRILIRIRWQVSEDRVVASLVARYIGARM